MSTGLGARGTQTRPCLGGVATLAITPTHVSLWEASRLQRRESPSWARVYVTVRVTGGLSWAGLPGPVLKVTAEGESQGTCPLERLAWRPHGLSYPATPAAAGTSMWFSVSAALGPSLQPRTRDMGPRQVCRQCICLRGHQASPQSPPELWLPGLRLSRRHQGAPRSGRRGCCRSRWAGKQAAFMSHTEGPRPGRCWIWDLNLSPATRTLRAQHECYTGRPGRRHPQQRGGAEDLGAWGTGGCLVGGIWLETGKLVAFCTVWQELGGPEGARTSPEPGTLPGRGPATHPAGYQADPPCTSSTSKWPSTPGPHQRWAGERSSLYHHSVLSACGLEAHGGSCCHDYGENRLVEVLQGTGRTLSTQPRNKSSFLLTARSSLDGLD